MLGQPISKVIVEFFFLYLDSLVAAFLTLLLLNVSDVDALIKRTSNHRGVRILSENMKSVPMNKKIQTNHSTEYSKTENLHISEKPLIEMPGN